MSAIQFSGLSSGLDTAGIIDALVSVDAQRLAPITESSAALESELTAVGRLKSYLDAFSSSIEDIASASSFYLSSITSNDESIITASSTGDADLGQGSVNIEVQSLAVNEKTQSSSFGDSSTDVGSSGTFSINGKNVSIVNSDSLSEIRDKINSTDNIGVVASIIKVTEGDYRLTISNDDGGTEGSVFGDGNGVLESLGITSGAQTIDTTSTSFESETSDLDIAGTFQINGTSVTVTDTDSLEDINTKLNSVSGVTATVSEVDGEYQIDLGGATLTDDSENVLGRLGLTASGKNTLQAGANAKIVIDSSIVIERTTNEIDDVIEGLKLNLNQAEVGTNVSIDFSRDYDAVKDKVQDFVNAYNVVVNYIGDQSEYDETTESAGDLGNSRVAKRVINDMRSIINTDHSDYLPSEYATLGNIGITTDASKGILNFDSSKLTEVMETNFDAFVKMFSNTESTSTSDLNLGTSTEDTQSGKYYADPLNNAFYDITEAEDATDSLPTSLDSSNSGEKYFLTTGMKMYEWSGSGWDGGSTVTSATVEFENGINTVTSGNGTGIGFDGSASGIITFTKGFAGLFDSLVNETMLGSTDGYFKSEEDRIDKTIDQYEDQYTRLEDRLTAYRERLVQQFAQVEMLMTEMKSQSSGLSSIATA